MKKTKEDYEEIVENFEEFEYYDKIIENDGFLFGGQEAIVSKLYEYIDDVIKIAEERIELLEVKIELLEESKINETAIDYRSKVFNLETMKLYLKHTKDIILTNKE